MDSNLAISLNVVFFQNGDGLSISEIPGLPTPAIFSHAGNALGVN
jgi:hypothetical protein